MAGPSSALAYPAAKVARSFVQVFPSASEGYPGRTLHAPSWRGRQDPPRNLWPGPSAPVSRRLARALFVLCQPQEALQQVRPPDRPHQEEPHRDGPHDRGDDEPRLFQDAEVVPDGVDRPDDKEHGEEHRGEDGRAPVRADLLAPAEEEAAGRLQEEYEEHGRPGDEDGEAALRRNGGDDVLVPLAPEGDSGVGLVGSTERVGDVAGV